MNRSCTSRSGAQYKSLSRPSRTSSAITRFSEGVNVELMQAAGMPFCDNASTWSFISEMSGDTTTAIPSRAMAGT